MNDSVLVNQVYLIFNRPQFLVDSSDIKYQIFIETIWGILIKCRNWCCSPLLLENPLWKPFFENYEKVKVNVTLNQ